MLTATNGSGSKANLKRAKYRSVTELAGGSPNRPAHLVELSTGLPGSDTSSTSVSFYVDAKDPVHGLFSEFLKFFVDEGHRRSADQYYAELAQLERRAKAFAGVGLDADADTSAQIHAGYALHTFYIPHQNLLQLVMRYSSRRGKQHEVRQLVENYIAHAAIHNTTIIEQMYDRFLQRTLRQISQSPDYVFSRTFNVIIGGDRGKEIPLVKGIQKATFDKLQAWLFKLIQSSTYSVQTNCADDLVEMDRLRQLVGGKCVNTYETVQLLAEKYREPLADPAAAVPLFKTFTIKRKAKDLRLANKTEIHRMRRNRQREKAVEGKDRAQ